MKPGPEFMLEELLRELFNDAELSRFLALNYPVAHDAMPIQASPATRRHHSVLALGRHGHIVDELFAALRAERPEQHARIAEVERACIRTTTAPPPRPSHQLPLRLGMLVLLALAAWGVRRWFTTGSVDERAAPASVATTLGSPGSGERPAPAAQPNVEPTAEQPRPTCKPGEALIVPPAAGAAFCIDVNEVTRKDFGLRCVGTREYRHGVPRSREHLFCEAGLPESEAERRPAAGVSPREATDYCRSLGKRLVDHHDWTAAVAAVLGDQSAEDLLEFVNVCGTECRRKKPANNYTHTDPYPETAPVGLLSLPQQGPPTIHDLFGNVHEIIATADGFKACGGGWTSTVRGSLTADRCLDPRNPTIAADTISWYGDLGFRCASEPLQPL